MAHPTSERPAVLATELSKSFGSVTALDGVNLAVPPGTLAALLGPNGAGKTTLVRILATLTRPDSGSAVVLGADVVRAPDQVRKLVGLTGQFAGLDDALTGRDILLLIGRLSGLRGEQRPSGRRSLPSCSVWPVQSSE